MENIRDIFDFQSNKQMLGSDFCGLECLRWQENAANNLSVKKEIVFLRLHCKINFLMRMT
jgi:hypothetical protein